MDLNKLSRQAKKIVDKRGGMQSVIADAKELKNIAAAHESLRDKAKAAAAALKHQGAAGEAEPTADPAPVSSPAAGPPPEFDPPPSAATEANPKTAGSDQPS